MYKVYDFHCDCGCVFERFVTSGTTTSRCGCGNLATKMLSAPAFILDGSTGDFPGRHIKWVKEHEQAGNKAQSPQ
tara:strand:+ start:1972 stop:2196 length:225 start_codon:yes stop_codon:yes gene_type:complete